MKNTNIRAADNDDELDVHGHVVSLNKTHNEIEEIGQLLVSKQLAASKELNTALKKLTKISMKTSQMGTSLEQNRAYEMLAEDKKVEVENLKKRVLDLEIQLVNEKKAMEGEMVVLRERLSGMKTMGFVENGNVELKKEIDELKTRSKELIEKNEALSKATRHKKTAVSAKKTLELECERMKLKDAMKHMGIVRDENLELKKEIDELKRKVEQKEVVVKKNEALDRIVEEKEDLQKQIIELEKQLDGKGKLELENEQLKENLSKAMKNICGGGSGDSVNSDQLKKVIRGTKAKTSRKDSSSVRISASGSEFYCFE
ncbi:hypothetical protein MKW98_005412 [Papaver atlanticum]|uniref:Uncharacterized protein n=1 Tax=Papaver atlanticum TaxID=357466 RepID=A0AAD4X3Z9_9MAGN|nr:hypothetical protein MKW98_005412 [Papaver atlanticum]